MYRFLRRPMWILSHVVVVLLITLAIALGFWQRSRYETENAKVDQIEARAALAPVPFDDAVDTDLTPVEVDPGVVSTRVEATGEYDTAGEVAILNRSQGGAPGAWILTPLVTDDGTAISVVRGWIPYDATGAQTTFPEAAPPSGSVTVTGTVQLTQERGSIGATDAADGRLSALARVDLARFAQQLDQPLAPAWVLLDDQQPAQPSQLPVKVEVEQPGGSQNFGYMVQWWIFATIALVGYPLILRRVARNTSQGDEVPDDPPPGIADGVDRTSAA